MKVSLLCMKASISQPMILVFSLDGTYLYQQKVRYLDSFSIITKYTLQVEHVSPVLIIPGPDLDSSCCAKLLRRKSDYPDSDFWQLLDHQDQKNSSFKKRNWDWAVHVGNVWQDLGRLQLRHDISLLFIGLHENLTEKISTIK